MVSKSRIYHPSTYEDQTSVYNLRELQRRSFWDAFLSKARARPYSGFILYYRRISSQTSSWISLHAPRWSHGPLVPPWSPHVPPMVRWSHGTWDPRDPKRLYSIDTISILYRYRYCIVTASIPYRYSIDTVSIEYRHCIDTVSMQYRCCIDTVSILYRYSIGTVSVLYRYSIDIISIQYRYSISYRYRIG